MRPPTQFPQEVVATEADDQPDPRMIGMMICTRLAGRAVIRVVGRCNEAKENERLGEWNSVESVVKMRSWINDRALFFGSFSE